MLVLSRNTNERIYLKVPANPEPMQITLVVCNVSNKGTIRLGIDAPEEVRIYRDDINNLEPAK